MTEEPSLDTLINYLREASLAHLKHLSGRGNIRISDLPKEPPVYAHWMSLILISGKALRVTFKTHFMTESARFFASQAYHLPASEISQRRALDFFREYCNFVAGGLKVVLAGNEVKAGTSLPALARGFDEIYFPRPSGSSVKSWQLNCESTKVNCSVHVEVFGRFEFKKIDDVSADMQGEVHFL